MVNVVTSFYNDLYKFNWSHMVEKLGYKLTIFQKNDQIHDDSCFFDGKYFNIRNLGKCDFAFLYYICKNYKNLDDFTIFTKINWYEQNTNFPQLLHECKNYDYIEVGWMPEIQCYVKNDKVNVNIQNPNNYWVANLNMSKLRLESDCNLSNCRVWYNKIFGMPETPQIHTVYSHGPCFSVSKNLIRRNSLSIYEYLLNEFLPKTQSFDKNCMQNRHPNWTENQILADVGSHYHDEFLRFYRVLFTQNVDENQFRIHKIL